MGSPITANSEMKTLALALVALALLAWPLAPHRGVHDVRVQVSVSVRVRHQASPQQEQQDATASALKAPYQALALAAPLVRSARRRGQLKVPKPGLTLMATGVDPTDPILMHTGARRRGQLMRKLLPTLMLRDKPRLSIKDLGLDPGTLDLDSGLSIFEYFPETS